MAPGFFDDLDIPKIKKTFGFGAMKDKEGDVELTNAVIAKDNNNAKGHDQFEWGIKRGISDFLMQFVGQWFDHCLRTYTEAEFHQKMAAGFDLYQDWQDNHYERYRRLVNTGRRMRRFIMIDEDKVTGVAVDRLSNNGWKIYASEINAIRKAILQVKSDIFKP